MLRAKNLKHKIALVLFFLFLFVGAVNSEQQYPVLLNSTSTPLAPRKSAPRPTISKSEREELLKQLKEEIKERVKNEVDQSFGRPFTSNLSTFVTALSILVAILGILVVLFPLAAGIFIWLLRQPLLAQISDEIANFREGKERKLDPLVLKAKEELDRVSELRIISETQRKNRILSQLDIAEQRIYSNLPDFVQEISGQISPAYWPSKAKNYIPLEYWRAMSGLIEEASIFVDFNPEVLSHEEYTKMGNNSLFAGYYKEAIKFYLKASERHIVNFQIILNLGITSERLGKYEEAIKYFDKARQNNAEDCIALTHQARTIFHWNQKQKQHDTEVVKAVRYLEQALQINSTYHEALYLLACYAAERQTTTKALDYLEQAIKIFPLYYREKAKEGKLFEKFHDNERFYSLISHPI